MFSKKNTKTQVVATGKNEIEQTVFQLDAARNELSELQTLLDFLKQVPNVDPAIAAKGNQILSSLQGYSNYFTKAQAKLNSNATSDEEKDAVFKTLCVMRADIQQHISDLMQLTTQFLDNTKLFPLINFSESYNEFLKQLFKQNSKNLTLEKINNYTLDLRRTKKELINVLNYISNHKTSTTKYYVQAQLAMSELSALQAIIKYNNEYLNNQELTSLIDSSKIDLVQKRLQAAISIIMNPEFDDNAKQKEFNEICAIRLEMSKVFEKLITVKPSNEQLQNFYAQMSDDQIKLRRNELTKVMNELGQGSVHHQAFQQFKKLFSKAGRDYQNAKSYDAKVLSTLLTKNQRNFDFYQATDYVKNLNTQLVEPILSIFRILSNQHMKTLETLENTLSSTNREALIEKTFEEVVGTLVHQDFGTSEPKLLTDLQKEKLQEKANKAEVEKRFNQYSPAQLLKGQHSFHQRPKKPEAPILKQISQEELVVLSKLSRICSNLYFEYFPEYKRFDLQIIKLNNELKDAKLASEKNILEDQINLNREVIDCFKGKREFEKLSEPANQLLSKQVRNNPNYFKVLHEIITSAAELVRGLSKGVKENLAAYIANLEENPIDARDNIEGGLTLMMAISNDFRSARAPETNRLKI